MEKVQFEPELLADAALAGITFIVKPEWRDEDLFIRASRAPIFMEKDGAEHFVVNWTVVEEDGSLYARQKNDNSRTLLRSLVDSQGKFAKFYGPSDDPLSFIKWARQRGGGFYDDRSLFDYSFDKAGYGAGFCDFHGNGLKLCPFHYRIFDKALLLQVVQAIQVLKHPPKPAKGSPQGSQRPRRR